MPLHIVTGPQSQPLDLCDLKKHLKLVVSDCASYTAEDGVLSMMIDAVSGSFQTKRKTQLIEADYRWDFKKFSRKLELPRPPLISVVSVVYVDSNGDDQTISAANYEVQAKRTPGYVRFYPEYEFPDDVATDVEYPVKVTYKAGYGQTAADVPAGIKLYLMNVIGTYYMQRESTAISYSAMTVEDLTEQMTHLIAGMPKPLRFG